MERYNHVEVEDKWRKKWVVADVYRTTEDADKEKFYILDMFPYPSGVGLHVGHPKGYIATDIISRYKKMRGFNVLHPMGWDAFGLPAEQYALKHKINPREAVAENVANFKKQLERISLNYDWSREINTTDPDYYKWTQWTFIQMFKRGLVHQSNEPINWCSSCKTGLANEDLEDGKCERCDSEIQQKKIRQWVIKITDYAERLLDDLDKLDWQDSIKQSQRNWIGKSEGALIKFSIFNSQFSNNEKISNESIGEIEVFTTRPDTLFGATYMVLAPEHSIISKIKDKISNIAEVEKYTAQTKKKSEIDRTDATREKTGVKLEGIMAINPANNEEIPIYIADYVLAHYGTGAIMAVPAHDERDFEFAQKFGIEVNYVISQQIVGRVASGVRRETVHVVLENDDGQILMQSKTNPNGQKVYCLPGGGIDEGETAVQAAKRELAEETGYIDCDIKDCIGVVETSFYAESKKVQREAVVYGYVAKLNSSKQADRQLTETEELEGLDHVWIKKDAALKKMYSCNGGIAEADGKILQRYMESDFCFSDKGILVNSAQFDNMDSEEAGRAITEFVGGKMTTTYKLRDWVFARQRYWGEPIPLIHCAKCDWVPVPDDQLPLVLPEVESYEPTGTGESPLAAIEDWVNTTCPSCGGVARRETNTMPQWAGSSWYYLRYIDPHNSKELVSKDKEKYWSPVDFYVGGAEHATRHLIYARFWHKFLYDIGVVSYDEPFTKLQTVGLIIAEDGRKMSKRWGNVVNPDEIIDRYGADTLRLYEMFMGPFEASVAWSANGLIGPRKFLEKIWKLAVGGTGISEVTADDLRKSLHQTISKVGADIEQMKYNTAISAMMVFVNNWEKQKQLSSDDFAQFLKILSPFAPHIAQELWERLGLSGFVLEQQWSEFDEKLLIDDEVTVVVQVNGKLRDKLVLPTGLSDAELESHALESQKVCKFIDGKKVRKVIVVKGRLVSIVV